MNSPRFTQITCATNPNGGCASLFALDESGQVWQYIFNPKGGTDYWKPLNPNRMERRPDP